MVHLGLGMIFLLWSEIAVLSSAVYLALINAKTGECVTVGGDNVLCNCVETDNYIELGIHLVLKDACMPDTHSSIDVPYGEDISAPTVHISSGFISSNTVDVYAWADLSGSLRFAPSVNEMFFDFETNCLTDQAGKQLIIETKAACLPKHRLMELNPYYAEPMHFNLQLNNPDTEESDASTQQTPPTNPKVSASTDTAETIPSKKTTTDENPEDGNPENNAPLPNRRRRRRNIKPPISKRL